MIDETFLKEAARLAGTGFRAVTDERIHYAVIPEGSEIESLAASDGSVRAMENMD